MIPGEYEYDGAPIKGDPVIKSTCPMKGIGSHHYEIISDKINAQIIREFGNLPQGVPVWECKYCGGVTSSN